MLGLADRVGIPSNIVHACTRRAFTAMIDLALAEQADFLIIAGDLYDGDWKDFSTGLFFAQEMHRFGRPCFLLRGNHDARSNITRDLTLPPNVHEFSSRTCQSFADVIPGVALHGHSFPRRGVPENLAKTYPPPVPDALNIGVLHTSADDPGEHETYAPCSITDLQLAGYDYWALGHIHARRILSENPWIVFPGNLQGRHPRETGAKGCTLVTLQHGRIAAVEHRSLDVLRWEVEELDLTGVSVVPFTAQLDELAARICAGAEGRPVLLRLILTGATPLHARLADDTEHIAAECRNAALALGAEVWVESVKIRTRPTEAVCTDALTPLRDAYMASLEDPAIASGLREHLMEIRQKLPAEARDGFDPASDESALRALAEDAWARIAEELLSEVSA